MNFNTFNPSSKVIKKLQNWSSGQPITQSDTPVVGVFTACTEYEKLTENVVAGIRAEGASSFVFSVPYFGYANKINPMTAKFSQSFRDFSKRTAHAIIKTNMLDGAVIITDCDVTACGLLEGCIENNCPVVVLPVGKCHIAPVEGLGLPITQIAGAVAGGKITSADMEEIIPREYMPKNQSDFFCLLEKIGLVVTGASRNRRASGAQIIAAHETGKLAGANTREVVLPKKSFTKSTWQDVVDLCIGENLALSNLELISHLFNAVDVKTPIEYIFERAAKLATTADVRVTKMTGTAIGGIAYAQTLGERAPEFNGRAWVYQNLEDADHALCGGHIPPSSVVVLQNCAGQDVTAIANVILGMGREREIAIATDGVCEVSRVLCVQLCSPNSTQNEEFANIQNGDELEIDVTRGRFNTDVLSKEIKIRQKRNTVKKPTMYF